MAARATIGGLVSIAALIVLAGSGCGGGQSRPNAEEKAACAHLDRLTFAQQVHCEALGLVPKIEPPAGFNAPWAGMTRSQVDPLARREAPTTYVDGQLGRASFSLSKRTYHGHPAWLIKYEWFCQETTLQPVTYMWKPNGRSPIEKRLNECG